MKQAVILAGGKGTRLKERLGDLPKPLIDLDGVPLLERQILLLKKYDFDSVFILVNYQAQKIIDFCNTKNNWDIDIRCIDDGEPRGTAGAILNIIDCLEDEFLVVYGDTMLEVDINRFYDFHMQKQGVAATLFLHPNDHPHDSDLVELNDAKNIIGFNPYPHDDSKYLPNLVNAALYWVSKTALLDYKKLSGLIDFGKNLFPMMLVDGKLLRGYNSPEYIKDVGTPSRIDTAVRDFRSGKIQRASLEKKQKAIFIDRDGTINYEVNHLNNANAFKLMPNVGSSIKKINVAEYKVCVVTNQPVIARGDCSLIELKQIHNKLETLIAKDGAFIDRIFYCPHHPDSGFEGEVKEYKIKCDCRKPNTLMIKNAVDELNIDVEKSWLIGDTSTDIELAKKTGLTSVLVETGYAGTDEKYANTPDFVMEDFSAAIEFILEKYPTLFEKIEKQVSLVNAGDVIFVGGQSRSGKSTFSKILANVLKQRGINSHIIKTDNWLKNSAERGNGVLARHDYVGFSDILEKIRSRKKSIDLSLPFYFKKTRKSLERNFNITVNEKDVVIVEGVIALHYANQYDVHKYYIELREDLRKKRMRREYAIRGEASSFDEIYKSRLEDEFMWVDATAKNSIRVNFNE
jgi:histidinol-phosphate phosphatase family protein